MKYMVDVDINLPRERVIELMDSEENLYKWMEGLESFEHFSGEPGQAGAVSKLDFRMGKRTVEMTETITHRDLPDEMHMTYDAPGVHNIVKNRFIELGPEKTRWESENEFQCRGLMWLMGLVMKGAFVKQSLKYMQDFKAFAEEGIDARTDQKATS